MNRRRFIGGLGILAGSLLGGTWLVRSSRRNRPERLLPSVEEEILRILRVRLDYLTIAEEDAAAFAADYRTRLLPAIRSEARPNNRVGRWLHVASRSYFEALREHDVRRVCSKESMENRVKMDFLASSSYFYNDADESVPVTYRRLDAIYGTCRNPFARFA